MPCSLYCTATHEGGPLVIFNASGLHNFYHHITNVIGLNLMSPPSYDWFRSRYMQMLQGGGFCNLLIGLSFLGISVPREMTLFSMCSLCHH